MESDGIEAYGVPAAEYGDYIHTNGWSYKHFGGNYGTVEFLKGIGVDGSTALQIRNMSDSSANNTYLYFKNSSKLILDTQKTYKLSYWAKTGQHNSRTDSFGIRFTNGKSSPDGITYSDTNKDVSIPDVPNDGQWHERSVYVKPQGAENYLELRVYRHFESLILDDFTLYEVDENLNVVDGAEDLLAGLNGNFEASVDDGSINFEYNFYPAYENGEIMDPAGISAISDLQLYDTQYLHAQVTVKNRAYADGKNFVFIMAVYKDGILEQVKSIKAQAAYVPMFAEGEKFGLTHGFSNLDSGEFEVRVFVWADANSMTPLSPSERLTEN